MKKIFQAKVLLLVMFSLILFAVPVLAGVTTNSVLNNDVKIVPSESLTQDINSIAVEKISDKLSTVSHWQTSDFKPTIKFTTLNTTDVVAYVDFEFKHKINYKRIDEDPVLKGKIKYKNQAKNLSSDKAKIVDKDISNWADKIKKYMNESQDGAIKTKVSAILNPDGTINKSSVRIEVVDAVEKEIPLDSYFIARSAEDIENEACQAMNSSIIQNTLTSQYNRSWAKTYITTYTSNATAACRTGSTTKQNSVYYNLSDFPTWYVCNDCCNYVSQAFNCGGVLLTSTWQPYTSAWINCNSFISYHTGASNIQASTLANMSEGDLITYQSGGSYYHIVMISYKDSYSTKIGAHTTDRKNSVFTGSSSNNYWHVIF